MSFCTETVFSDEVGAKLKFLTNARRLGFAVIMLFIGLENSDLCVARVMQRVANGGHDVPDEKLRARFPRVIANLHAAVSLVDEAFLFDNSSFDEPYRPVAVYVAGKLLLRQLPVPAWAQGLPDL